MILFVIGNPAKHADGCKKSPSSASSSDRRNQHALETQSSAGNKKLCSQEFLKRTKQVTRHELACCQSAVILTLKYQAIIDFQHWKLGSFPEALNFIFFLCLFLVKSFPLKQRGKLQGRRMKKHSAPSLPLSPWCFISLFDLRAAFCGWGMCCPRGAGRAARGARQWAQQQSDASGRSLRRSSRWKMRLTKSVNVAESDKPGKSGRDAGWEREEGPDREWAWGNAEMKEQQRSLSSSWSITRGD